MVYLFASGMIIWLCLAVAGSGVVGYFESVAKCPARGDLITRLTKEATDLI